MLLPVALALCSLLAAPANLAPNPSFELADAGSVACWEARTPSGPLHTMGWSDELAFDGTRSLTIASLDPKLLARWRTGQLRDVAFRPGATVTLSAMVRCAGVADHAQLRFYCLDAQGGVIHQPASSPMSGDQPWTRLAMEATVPPNAAYAMAYLELFGAGQVWFDAVEWRGESIPPPGMAEPVVLTADDVWDVTGYQAVNRQNRTMLQLAPGVARGEALFYAPGPAARYEVAVVHLDQPDGAGALELRVDGRSVATHALDRQPGSETAPVTWTVPDVDLQTHSRIVIAGTADQAEPARILGLRLRAASGFQGELQPLVPPPSLKVAGRPQEQGQARGQLSLAVEAAADALTAAREARLATFRTADDWRGEQRHIRSELADYFGPFPERTPLNPKLLGTIARPEYTIEKIVIESRPGFLVSTNLYLPAKRSGKAPGVLFCCGHSVDGKAALLYHETCLGLVLKGYVVLAFDPTGQGERKEFFDPAGKPIGPVPQHHQLGRPLFLVGQTLSGLRIFDGLRAVDYLISRPEVDPARLGVVGNSGGGQESLQMAAVDERLSVCVAAHPGGPMENTYLNGQGLRDREILSLIAPRPCRFIVGKDSGELAHADKVKDMARFYKGLGAPEKLELAWVEGVHNMERPKREATYPWLNRWLKVPADDGEPPLEPLTAEELWCAPNGSVIRDLWSKAGLQVAAEGANWPLRGKPTDPVAERAKLQAAVDAVLRLKPVPPATVPVAEAGRVAGDGFAARLLRLEAGDRWLPAVLLVPAAPSDKPVVLYVSEDRKPARADRPSVPVDLCRAGHVVLSVDVRGVGELDSQQGRRRASAQGFDADQWRSDSLAIGVWGYAGGTLTAWQTADVMAACDALVGLPEAAGQPVLGVGEGKGQIWMLLAAAQRPAIQRVIGRGGLLSFRSLLEQPDHEVREYTWMPGAPAVFDLCELPALVAPRRVDILAPIDATGQPARGAEEAFGWARELGAVVEVREGADVLGVLGN